MVKLNAFTMFKQNANQKWPQTVWSMLNFFEILVKENLKICQNFTKILPITRHDDGFSVFLALSRAR